jgi:predicted dehydrogenase
LKQLQVGFLGLSHPHCGGRLKAVTTLDETSLNWVYDENQILSQNTAKEFTTQAPSSPLEALAQSQTELIVIEGNNLECARYAEMSLKAGKHVLVEKPGGPNHHAIQQVAEMAKNTAKQCFVGYHLRFSPSVQDGIKFLKAGILGRVTTARFHAAVMAPALTDKWFCDPADRGGLVFLDFCHLLDILILAFGQPTNAIGTIRKLAGLPEHPFEDSATFLFEFGDILTAGDCCGWEANEWITTWDVQIFGTEGTLRIGIHPPTIELFLRTQQSPFSEGWNGRQWDNYDGDENYKREFQDLTKTILQGTESSACSIQNAAEISQIIEQLYQMNRL